jgi:inosine-uridine nucleoside N-ribohydrolase
MGARHALARTTETNGAVVHGDNGLGGAVIRGPSSTMIGGSAAETIVDVCRERAGETTLVTLAPLTNIALALALEPGLPELVQGISLMGGAATVPGNNTPTAESNIFHDPEAAHQVFASGIPITMAGLDVTHRAPVSADYLDELRNIGNQAGAFVHAAAQHYLQFYLQRGEEGLVMHDVHAIMVLLRPEIYSMRQVRIDVETAGNLTAGQTVADWRGQWGRPAQTQLLVDVDAQEFRREFKVRIARLA